MSGARDYEKVREIFRRAVELEEPDRTRVVEEACAGDAALRGEVLDLLAAATAATAGLRPEAGLVEPPVPAIEGYEVGPCLGRGGMGLVHRGRERETGDEVAIKFLHPWFNLSPRTLERFRREANVGIRVRHENLVPTRELGVAGAEPYPRHYLVMDYIEGRTLDRLAAEYGPVPETLLREIARQVARGLQAIHDAGILHRDLKPENILINDEQRVLIMDLGIAKLSDDSIDLTQDGQFLGSLAYAAPEQFDGEELDRTADLYALGVLLYELAAGENPFRFDQPLAAIRAHKETALTPLQVRVPRISAFFSDVVAALTAKTPADRFGSARALEEVLAEGEQSSWWRARTAPTPARLPDGRRETPLVGRSDEFQLLQQAWSRAGRGEGGTVLVTGEAGSGKTRLVTDWAASIADGAAHVLYGSFPPDGGAHGLLQAARGRESAIPSASLRAILAARLRGEVTPEHAPPQALAAALAQLFRHLAADRPTVWIVDDMHFASAESAAAVRSLALVARESRALLVVTQRPNASPALRDPAFGTLSIELERLDRAAVADMLHARLQHRALAEQLATGLWERSDGIPLFVLQIIDAMIEQGVVVPRPEGGFELGRVQPDFATPDAVREIVQARLDDLSPPQRRLADAAAVAGLEFDPALVAAVVEEPLLAVLQDLADLERRAGLVRSRGALYRFDHHVVHETLYEAIPPALAAELHYRTAEVLRARAPEPLAPADAHAVVRHHLRGREPAAALACIAEARRFAEGRAQTGYDLAVLALGIEGLLTGAERMDMLLLRAHSARQLGFTDDQLEALEEGLALARAAGDRRRETRVRAEQAAHGMTILSNEKVVESLREVLELSKETGERMVAAKAATNIATTLSRLGRHDEARAYYEHATEWVRKEAGESQTIHVRIGLGILERVVGNHDLALEILEDVAVTALDHGQFIVASYAYGNIGAIHMVRNDYELSLEAIERQRLAALDSGDFQSELLSHQTRGMIELARGYLAESFESKRRAIHLARLCGSWRALFANLATLAFLEITCGRFDAARRALEQAEEGIARTGADDIAGQLLLLRGNLAEEEGDRARAVDLAKQSIARTLPEERAMPLIFAGVLRERAGDIAAARAHWEESLRLTRRTGATARFSARAFLASTPEELETIRTELDERDQQLAMLTRISARFRVWERAGETGDLIEARRLLQRLRSRAPAECRDTMVRHNSLFRAIEDAWAELG